MITTLHPDTRHRWLAGDHDTLAPPLGDLETPPLAAARPKINPSRTATHHRPVALQDATTGATITTRPRTPATGDWQTSTTLAPTAAP
ncbi:hypothetical protein [Amycolatopsis thermoflava]|uniref:hypothetical protein n=1 Tax=Amycolatopsis thermoflava TaxID=84480 RepID=UPI000F4B60F3|nr:hypothetical protein [Amycolatopsis thermoflava]